MRALELAGERPYPRPGCRPTRGGNDPSSRRIQRRYRRYVRSAARQQLKRELRKMMESNK